MKQKEAKVNVTTMAIFVIFFFIIVHSSFIHRHHHHHYYSSSSSITLPEQQPEHLHCRRRSRPKG